MNQKNRFSGRPVPAEPENRSVIPLYWLELWMEAHGKGAAPASQAGKNSSRPGLMK